MEVNILTVEDDYKSQQLLKEFLTSNGYKVDCAEDGLEAIQMYKENYYDLVLLDINIPNLDGFSVCKMIRKESDIPIIFVTELSSEKDQIKAFDLLCDDYIIKPFSFNLLIRRIQAVLRRAKIDKRESYITFEKIKLNLKTYSVEIEDEVIDLTLKEFKILKALIENYPQVVTREKLLDNIWGYDYFGDTRIVDAHIKNIRKKIVLPYIKTVKGIGYTLKKDA
ncbi:response regulator transcription factor [Intestinibacter sp.]|uniref:response regulator transcription factor n=1 Tax=Intestinibacter sp. TaxID=1965304 RepID=UPI002A75B771|nr:response regulator transcription factor [Intestinibacter sp.]MDY2735116.1 response regulator transcription factor [Intestinibacter sp.]MDY4575595.1 response regulator transcription factor [Intestinibacter sp.]